MSAAAELAVRGVLRLQGALSRLAWALLPPEARVLDVGIGAAKAYAVRAAIRVGVFDELHERPGATSADLAARLGLHPDATHRFLRALATLELLEVDEDGRFSNSPAGAACRRGNGVGAFVEYFASASNLRAWDELEHALRTGTSSFALANGRPVWTWLEEHPDELEAFTDAMASLTGAWAGAIVRGYPFDDVGTVCDVGGGRGVLAGEILRRNPAVELTLVERPSVLAAAERHLSEIGVRDRATLVAGDFFRSVPSGHGAYVLKNVLHDWDDARALEILGVVRAACGRGTRLLVVEERQEALQLGPTAISDLQMMVVCDGGRERSEADYGRLFRASGFDLLRTRPTGSLMVLFEGAAR